jgi:hypothetical protein
MRRDLFTACMFAALTATRLSSAVSGQAAKEVVIEVQAGRHDRQGVPVSCEIPGALADVAALKLVQADNGRAVPAQVVPGPRPSLVWMIDGKLPAGSTRRYRLTGGAAAAPSAAKVSAMMGDHDLLLAVGSLPVLRYQHAVMPSADPELPYYARSGFIHPVYDPRKRMLTDSMPADHMHQHGLMFAWVNTTFEGRKVDFWNSKQQQGEIRHAGFDGRCSGPVLAGFTARLDHVDRTAPGGPKTVLHETWEVRVYNRADGFLFDLRSTQNCAGSEPLVINKYDYGGMCIRGTSAWLEAGQSDFLTSEGKNRRDGNHTRPFWCDLSGQLEGQASGITCFCHPANFRYPQPVRLHPSKPYFCWAPMVLGPFAIEPGKPYVSAYRFHVHAGKPDRAVAERLCIDYVDPPQVRFVAE